MYTRVVSSVLVSHRHMLVTANQSNILRWWFNVNTNLKLVATKKTDKHAL